MQSTSILVQDLYLLELELNRVEFHRQERLLIQLFSSYSREQVSDASRVISARFPRAVLIGSSANHFISRGDVEQNGLFLVITQFDSVGLTSAVVQYSDDLSHDSTHLFTQLDCTQSTQAIICFADRLTLSQKSLFSAFNQSDLNIPISGGASTITNHGRWVMLNGQCYENAYVAVALNSDELSVWTRYYTEWNPIGKTFRVTSADGNIIHSLDNTPIRKIYNRYLADGNDTPLEQLHNFPLMEGDPQQQKIYLPIKVHSQDSIEFDGEIVVGDEVRFCYDHPSLTLEQLRLGIQQIAPLSPEEFFVYNCTSRIDFIEGNQEVSVIQELADCYGTYCMGELFHDDGEQKILHHSLTYLVMREGKPSQDSVKLPSHSSNAISPLFSLIRNALVDVDEMNKSMANKIQRQASDLTESYRIDRRTLLSNRSVLREKLVKMNAASHLLSLKVTNFSQINEKYGYPVGDQLLRDLSDYFKSILRRQFIDGCQLYSIGVGEWAIVFESSASDDYIQQRFSQFADQIEHVNFEPFGLPDIEYLSVSVCGGLVSRCDFPDESIDDLLLKSIEARRAAVNHNKHLMNARSLKQLEQNRQEQLGWLSCVSRAVLHQNVIAFAQPIVAAGTHQTESLECLVRIEEDGVVIPPGKFLPIIEGTHLYTRLSRQMISRTFEHMSQTTDSFSINLSPQDLINEKTLLHLEDSIRKISHPQRIGLEVLETEQIKDYGRMIEVCNHFRDLGVSIIVDDFGSGYSNIDEIIKLEPQVIKLDGSLIRNIDHDVKQRKIAQQLVSLCQILNAKTVAEFVHNREICQIAEDMGVDYLQGFYFGQPQRLF